MLGNRFENCKTLGDLYNIFATEDVSEYNKLTDEELDRVALVFEANKPDKIDMPDTPLTIAGYTFVWNVTVDTVDSSIDNKEGTTMGTKITLEELENMAAEEEIINNANMEDNNMNNINEEVAAAKEATENAEKNESKLAAGFKFVVNNISSLADKATDIVGKLSGMNDEELEEYLEEHGKGIIDDVIKGTEEYSEDLGFVIKRHPKSEDLKKQQKEAKSIVVLIKDTIGDKEKSGWAKFKDIVKAIVVWLVKLFLKVASIVLKLAFTIAVGAIKVGIITLVTAGKAVGVINKEIVKPTIATGKELWAAHKERVAKKAEEAEEAEDDEEAEYEEIREAIFGDDIDDEDVDVAE